jgi:hypothetical protein
MDVIVEPSKRTRDQDGPISRDVQHDGAQRPRELEAPFVQVSASSFQVSLVETVSVLTWEFRRSLFSVLAE